MKDRRSLVIATTAIAAFIGLLVGIAGALLIDAPVQRHLVFATPVVAAVGNLVLWKVRSASWTRAWGGIIKATGVVQGAVSLGLLIAAILMALTCMARLGR